MHLCFIFSPILLFHYISLKNTLLNIIITTFFIFFNGTRMRALGNIIHECCHYTFVPGKKLNTFLGKTLCTLELNCFHTYQKEHFSHHRYLGNILYDEDFKIRHKLGICDKNPFKISRFLKIIFSPKNWYFLFISSIKLKIKSLKSLIFYTIYLSAFICLCYLFGFQLIFLFIIIPFLTTYQMMKLMSDFLDHGGLYFRKDDEFKTRNHYFSIPLLNWIFFPRSDCFHLVHHLYPRLPSNFLYKKHEHLLEENDNYKKRRHCIF
ncbi:fatty acid desaturase family protein [Silvanigrella aquatica]|uniref:Fatty acid desaturase domain-containing protein n=1 Tax=Silvanigrella aquatica TaxID=1915309 RepID=A0A1L4D221_9BACT|nr:fatty acid desaturase [Silvanigrella aquatica]APJ04253.1 hypothetical protein AXG55_10175 [Silvanigrella aquatica]